jgi:hypothetical protein
MTYSPLSKDLCNESEVWMKLFVRKKNQKYHGIFWKTCSENQQSILKLEKVCIT